MELGARLQELRKEKNMTQEELAEVLYVSRAAVSKWESGRGCPNLESLQGLARFFGVSVDALLTGEGALQPAQVSARQTSRRGDLIYGLLDCGTLLLLFLPIFGLREGGGARSLSLLAAGSFAPYLWLSWIGLVLAHTLQGILTLSLQNCAQPFWVRSKRAVSLLLSGGGVLLFSLTLQPYGAALLLAFLLIKVFFLTKGVRNQK